MGQALPAIYLARHGETAWSISGQHTGLTDLALTERGERNARSLGQVLHGRQFAHVYCSPLKRARQTCELAGYAAAAEIEPDLVEWNYGEFEGRITADIRKEWPDWDLFRDGCPGGESVADISARADRVAARLRPGREDVILFSSGHFLRVLASRWLNQEIGFARYLYLSTATLSILGYDHNLNEPALRLWNDDRHVCESKDA
jgi:broad specificity phosphatase PhoE